MSGVNIKIITRDDILLESCLDFINKLILNKIKKFTYVCQYSF